MKKIAIVFYFVLYSHLLLGQVKYEILSSAPTSKILNNEIGDYINLTSSTIVEPEDLLYVNGENEITLVELTTGKPQVYINVTKGYMSVSELIVSCNKHNSNMLGRIVNNVTSESEKRSSGIRWSAIGAGNRGEYILDLASILRKDLLSVRSINREKSLQLIKHKEGVVFYPEFVNTSNDTLFVNFIAIHKRNKSLSLCFNLIEGVESYEIVLPPNSNYILNGFYYIDSNKYKYVVFGTQKPFNNYDLTKALVTDNNYTLNNSMIKVKYGIVKKTRR